MINIDSLVNYIGHFHPLIVHLPIGFIVFLIFLEIYGLIFKHDFRKVTLLLLVLSASSAALSCIVGYMLSLSGGYDSELLEEHQWEAIGLTVIICVSLLLYYYSAYHIIIQYAYKGSILLMLILLMETGHHGGSLTHGTDYLSISNISGSAEYQAPEIKDINTAKVYDQIVQPIFYQKCTSCHNAQKQKGELRLDTYEMCMKGGESGKVVQAGKPDESELIKLINLEPSAERAMPPKGKTPLTYNEIEIIKWWIESGADTANTVANLKPSDKMLKILKAYAQGSESVADEIKLPEAAPADENAIAELKKMGLNVYKVAQHTHLYDVRCAINTTEWDDVKTQKLLKIKDNIFILNLSTTTITSASLEVIGKMPNLYKLYLQNTGISDQNMDKITNLQNLQSLNLYNTKVSDASAVHWAKLKNLKKLYLWNTSTSPQVLQKIATSLPDIMIIIGKDSVQQVL
ncbi:MAG: c-type cytochrome domain-containing protein [Cytophagales bacterium]|nr:c-type cytochrome domain-containing protein [Cytophagales bacterium]